MNMLGMVDMFVWQDAGQYRLQWKHERESSVQKSITMPGACVSMNGHIDLI